MVTVIGFAAVGGLIWVLATSLARECDAERRRTNRPESRVLASTVTEQQQNLPLAA
ncbi:MAG: hypothetical protein U0412_05765 [Nitrospira sp.]